MPKPAKKKAVKKAPKAAAKAAAPEYSISGITCPITGEDVRFVDLGVKWMGTTSLYTTILFDSKEELIKAFMPK